MEFDWNRDDKYRIGKTALKLAHHGKAPIVVCKNYFEREKNDSKGFNFCCCLDGSKKSFQTLKYATDMARGEFDKVSF